MRAYIVFLRAVTPTGKNKVPLAPLRETLDAAGFSDVRTYIQSGNIFVSSELSARDVERKIHQLIKEQLGPDLVVVARTVAQLQKAFDDSPFKEGYVTSKVFFAFFAQSPPPQKVKELLDRDYGDEVLIIVDKTAYMYIPGVFTKAKLGGHLLEKRLGISVTVRNFSTTNKLVEISKTHFLLENVSTSI